MKELFGNTEQVVPSRIAWYWKDLVFSFEEIDPAFLFTVLQALTFGNKYFREYAHYNYAYYISRSPVWVNKINEFNLSPEDLCSSYGLFAIPYLYAYSFGFKKFSFTDLYDVEIMRPYIIQYIKKLYIRHDRNIGWIMINYKYLGNINKVTIKKFRRSFVDRKRFYNITYSLWKKHLVTKELWHETII